MQKKILLQRQKITGKKSRYITLEVETLIPEWLETLWPESLETLIAE